MSDVSRDQMQDGDQDVGELQPLSSMATPCSSRRVPFSSIAITRPSIRNCTQWYSSQSTSFATLSRSSPTVATFGSSATLNARESGPIVHTMRAFSAAGRGAYVAAARAARMSVGPRRSRRGESAPLEHVDPREEEEVDAVGQKYHRPDGLAVERVPDRRARRDAAVVGVRRAEVDAQPVALAAALAVGDGGAAARAHAPRRVEVRAVRLSEVVGGAADGDDAELEAAHSNRSSSSSRSAPGPPARILPSKTTNGLPYRAVFRSVPAAASHATTALSHEPRPGALHQEEHARLEHQLPRGTCSRAPPPRAGSRARSGCRGSAPRAASAATPAPPPRGHRRRRRRPPAPRTRHSRRAAHQLDARVLEHREGRAATAFDVLVAMAARASATDGAERRMSGSIGVPSISSRISGSPDGDVRCSPRK